MQTQGLFVNVEGIEREFRHAYPGVHVRCNSHYIWFGWKRYEFSTKGFRLFEIPNDPITEQEEIDKCRRTLVVCRLKGYL